MNVVFLARRFSPHVGGVEKHLAELAAELSQRHTITIVTEQYDKVLPLEDQALTTLRIERIPLRRQQTNKWDIWRWWLTHFTILRNADVIHVHDVFFWLLPFLLFIPKKKLFITFHGYEGNRAPNWRQRFWHQLAAWCCAGSIGIGGFHEKWYGVRPTITSYGAVSQRLPALESQRNGDLIFLGRLSEDTGIRTYLLGLAELKKQGINRHLDVYGDGPLRTECEGIALANHLSVRFRGFVPGASRLLPQYKVALVSRHLAILETLAAGVPIIAAWDTNIKHDYLTLAPFARWISIAHTPQDVTAALKNVPLPDSCSQAWAQTQTWEKLAAQYELLWSVCQSTQRGV